MPESLSSSWMSSSRQCAPLISYSPAPSRNIRRVIETSEYSIGRAPSELSMVSVTSARPSAARPAVPAKMTSSIFPPRSAFAPCSPSTQLIASTTLDLPDPFGPTTQVMPGSRRSVVAEAKDLKPFSVRLLRCTALQTAGNAEAYRPLSAGPLIGSTPSGRGEQRRQVDVDAVVRDQLVRADLVDRHHRHGDLGAVQAPVGHLGLDHGRLAHRPLVADGVRDGGD